MKLSYKNYTYWNFLLLPNMNLLQTLPIIHTPTSFTTCILSAHPCIPYCIKE